MNISERAQRDFKRFSGDSVSGFGVEFTITAPTGETATLNGFTTDINYQVEYDESGKEVPVNSRKASIVFSEGNLTDANANFPIRVDGEVNLKKCKVDFKNSTGEIQNMYVMQWFPDQKIGGIVLVLGERKD